MHVKIVESFEAAFRSQRDRSDIWLITKKKMLILDPVMYLNIKTYP